MKTITKNNGYERVSDEIADIKVATKGYRFAAKSEWKAADKIKAPEPEIDAKTILEEYAKKSGQTIEEAKATLDKFAKQQEKKKNYQKPKRS